MKTPCSQHVSWYAQTLKTQQRDSSAEPRTWIGMTEQDKEDTMEWLGHDVSSQVFYAIEAKLKEKNT
jgi:hypothetical protein